MERLAKLLRDRLGIEQQDGVLTDDGESILIYGHTADPDRTFVARAPVPAHHVGEGHWSSYPVIDWQAV